MAAKRFFLSLFLLFLFKEAVSENNWHYFIVSANTKFEKRAKDEEKEKKQLPRLKVSQNGRYLIKSDGSPFFYLGDTAWELFTRPNQEEAFYYLEDRAKKGFTVIQAVVVSPYTGLSQPNVYGHLPFLEKNTVDQPNENYFKNIDAIVNKAEDLGLYIAMAPVWGDKWNRKWAGGPEILTPENSRKFGSWLAQRYQNKPIIWVLGGDRPIDTEKHKAIIRAMAEGLQTGDGGTHLITFHPGGDNGISSSWWLHNEKWLDFNMMQSGHALENNRVYDWIKQDYEKTPAKPCLDGEPNYEDHPVNWNVKNRYFDDYDVRKAAYWSLFAGACGFTYGCNDVWQFFSPKFPSITGARTLWKDALQLPGAVQMTYVRQLMESRPFLSRIPDQTLLASDAGTGAERVQATRDADRTYGLIYLPTGKPVKIRMDFIREKKAKAYWFNPRSGKTGYLGKYKTQEIQEFNPPTNGHGEDWVLIIDSVGKRYPVPGQ